MFEEHNEKKKKKEIPRNTEQTWGKCYVNNQWQNM